MQPNFDRVPEAIQPLLRDYVTLLEQECPDLVRAVYLHGSIALGAFDPNQSDVDFITVLNRRCDEADIEHLRKVHQQIVEKYPRWKMDGSYLQLEDLGQSRETITPYPYCPSHDGVLQPSGHYEINPVTWWLLKTRGIAVVGADPRTLDFPASWEIVSAYTRENLNTYWANWTRHPGRILTLLTNYGVEWAVLGVLRLYCALRENEIVTKRAAGELGLAAVPEQWHKLIQEAISIRDTGKGRFYQLRPVRALETVRFLRYIIQTCNAEAAA